VDRRLVSSTIFPPVINKVPNIANANLIELVYQCVIALGSEVRIIRETISAYGYSEFKIANKSEYW
jgi:hypothetical protein